MDAIFVIIGFTLMVILGTGCGKVNHEVTVKGKATIAISHNFDIKVCDGHKPAEAKQKCIDDIIYIAKNAVSKNPVPQPTPQCVEPMEITP